MPTPFTHLRISQKLLLDPRVPQELRDCFARYKGDFLLGGIIADARPESGKRADTHFYDYTKPMPDNPWREMFRHHPSLLDPVSNAHRVFLAAYVAHLASDEYWSRYMLYPNFAMGNWGAGMRERFHLLHFLLIHMDERDEKVLEDSTPQALRQSEPRLWLPFLSDLAVGDWRDYIAIQLETESDTLKVFGSRIETEPEAIRRFLDDESYMQEKLWQHVTPTMLAEHEEKLYDFSREQMLIYWNEY